MNLSDITSFSTRAKLSYEKICAPLCKEIGFPQVALDIVVFLFKNPDMNTASDIAENRHIKPNLISNYVEKLVNAGYMTRSASIKDRRIIELVLTEKGLAAGRKGRDLQQRYFEILTNGLSEDELRSFSSTLSAINDNLRTFSDK